ncbi:MAG: radical SAM protein [Polyangiaceae bacterium]
MPPAGRAATIRRRLAAEVGRIDKHAAFRVALAYPSPYRAGMSSLGYQQIYKQIQAEPDMACERVFLPDEDDPEPPVSYEGHRGLAEFPVIALSVAYELELSGLVSLFDRARLPVLRADRDHRHPIVLAGGPLTFSNPLPLAPFADAILLGEADTLAVEALRILREIPSRADALAALAALRHVFVPSHHGSALPPVAQCDDSLLPAWGPIRAPEAELSSMFLIETERGCSRGCTYCVMRRSTNGGMRIVPHEKILSLIPDDARRVGLVGAAVSDHPKIVDLLRALADRGCEAGLSSLRPDRLTDDFVGALRAVGYRTLTTAMDGTSERVRESLERRARPRHLTRAAELARAHGMSRLKLYLMVGVPGETDADVDECAAFVTELSKIVPVALGIAPFCPKRNTPLSHEPFAGISVVESRLARLRKGLRGRAEVRSTSAKWAWVEAVLATGGEPEGLAVMEATRNGGSFAAYKSAFAAIGAGAAGKPFAREAPPEAPTTSAPTARPRRPLPLAPPLSPGGLDP